MGESTCLLVIGAGPAGVAASLQAHRDGVGHIVVSREPVGGLVPAAWRIDNLGGYPGGVRGPVLARSLARQVESLGVHAVSGEVVGLRPSATEGFEAALSSGAVIECRSVIVASGTIPAPWRVPGSDEAAEAGRLHRDVRTLPADLQGMSVAIVGGGDAAFDSALTAHSRGAAVTILMRSSRPAAGGRLVDSVAQRSIAVLDGRSVESVRGSGSGGRLMLDPSGLEADHLIVCVGRIPGDALVRGLVPGWVPDGRVETVLPGLFVAGDLTNGRDRFIASAMGQGQRAALLARALFRA